MTAWPNEKSEARESLAFVDQTSSQPIFLSIPSLVFAVLEISGRQLIPTECWRRLQASSQDLDPDFLLLDAELMDVLS